MDILNVPITSVMTTDVVTVEPNQLLVEVKHIFEKKNFHHHIPVTEGKKLLGIISLTDFLFAINSASLDDNSEVYHRLKVKDIMRTNPISISASSTLRNAAEILAGGEIHAIVVSDFRNLEGILSTADIIRFFLKEGKRYNSTKKKNKAV